MQNLAKNVFLSLHQKAGLVKKRDFSGNKTYKHPQAGFKPGSSAANLLEFE